MKVADDKSKGNQAGVKKTTGLRMGSRGKRAMPEYEKNGTKGRQESERSRTVKNRSLKG